MRKKLGNKRILRETLLNDSFFICLMHQWIPLSSNCTHVSLAHFEVIFGCLRLTIGFCLAFLYKNSDLADFIEFFFKDWLQFRHLFFYLSCSTFFYFQGMFLSVFDPGVWCPSWSTNSLFVPDFRLVSINVYRNAPMWIFFINELKSPFHFNWQFVMVL